MFNFRKISIIICKSLIMYGLKNEYKYKLFLFINLPKIDIY